VITCHDVATKFTGYLRHRLTLEELVDWAEKAMMEEELEEDYLEELRDIISHFGLADVERFGLTWEDCENYLSRLGYRVRIEVSKVG